MIEHPVTQLEQSEPASASCSARPRPTGPVAVPPTGLAPQTRLGDWLIDRQIGAGGMGIVYAATHALIGKRVAIKLVRADQLSNPRACDRFVQEAKIVNAIGHPNIVDIFHIGWLPDNRPFLVMELLTGRTLGRRLIDGHPLPQEAISILLQICDALTFAHAHGVVHRDLKPQNIFLVETPAGTHVKVLDWGVAKLMDRDSVAETFTTTGALVGTPHYISPEQARAKNVDGRADVYSLGAMAYELFLGRPPFIADNIADLITMQLRELPTPPRVLWSDIPPALDTLLLAMLEKKADDRPGIAEVRTALCAVQAQLQNRALVPPTSALVLDESNGASAIDRIVTWDMPRLAEGSGQGPSPRALAAELPTAQPAVTPAVVGDAPASFFRSIGLLAAAGFRKVVGRRDA